MCWWVPVDHARVRFSLILLIFVLPCLGAEVWKIQYFYDKNESTLEIRDFQCPTAEHCVVAGLITYAKYDPQGVTIWTDDGGAHWSQSDVKEEPQALTFLDARAGWMATSGGVWKTSDGGKKWSRLAKLPGLDAIYFLDATRGFAAGYPKLAYQTTDGGKTWTRIDAASEPETGGRPAIYDFIAFAGPQHGFILGHSQNTLGGQVPAWLDPQRAQRRLGLGLPATRIILETKDGGKTWKSFAKTGASGLIQLAPGPQETALGLFDFPDFSELATEVRRLDLTTDTQRDSFAAPNRRITSMALFSSEGVLAAVQVEGQLKQLPIPGKLIVLVSEDLESWTEMRVDYRAVARRAMLSGPDPRHLWVATDTGLILKRSGQ